MRNYNMTSDKFIYVIPENHYGNCVWVMDPKNADAPHLTDTERSWAKVSNIEMIDINEENTADSVIFGKRPDNWCMYYQEAELLQQKKDWGGIAMLYEEVVNKGYSPFNVSSNSPFEWLPFITGLQNSGQHDNAESLIQMCIEVDSEYSWLRE